MTTYENTDLGQAPPLERHDRPTDVTAFCGQAAITGPSGEEVETHQARDVGIPAAASLLLAAEVGDADKSQQPMVPHGPEDSSEGKPDIIDTTAGQHADDPEGSEGLSGRLRESAMRSIVVRYRNHSGVIAQLSQHMRPVAATASKAMWDSMREQSKRFKLLSKEEACALFGLLDRGMEVYAQLQEASANTSVAGPLDMPLSSEQYRSLLDLTYAYERLFGANQGLVADFALRFSWLMPAEDLIQEGNEGLMEAIGRFDTSLGYQFSSCAVVWIRKKVLAALADQSRDIRLPRNIHDEWVAIDRAVETLMEKLGRVPKAQEISAALGDKFSPEYVTELQEIGRVWLLSLHMPVGKHGETELKDFIASREDFTKGIISGVDLQRLFSQSGMNEREMFVLGMRFGLDVPWLQDVRYTSLKASDVRAVSLRYSVIFQRLSNQEREKARAGHTVRDSPGIKLEQLADALGITKPGVRRIEQEGLKKLRKAAGVPAANIS